LTKDGAEATEDIEKTGDTEATEDVGESGNTETGEYDEEFGYTEATKYDEGSSEFDDSGDLDDMTESTSADTEMHEDNKEIAE
jgi:hypothetical protein